MGNKTENGGKAGKRHAVPRLMFGEKGSNGAGRRAKDNKSGILSFSYRYDGTIGGSNYVYGIEKRENGVFFTYESMMYHDLGKAEVPVDNTVPERLNDVYLSCRLAEWDGYSKYNPYVCDGEGFSLSIRFNDGASLYTNGMNAFPDRYAEFCAAMSEILDPIRDKVIDSVKSASDKDLPE